MTQSSYDRLVKGLTAKDILEQFPDVSPIVTDVKAPSSTPGSANSEDDHHTLFQGQDAEQIKLMEEVCIVVDYNDTPVGAGSKKTCHLMTNIDKGLLHRAFSVFLFDESGRLLLQQRADEKITFANMWTNTCCSHPLAVPQELGQLPITKNFGGNGNGDITYLGNAVAGAKSAAQRKLYHELGIEADEIPLDDFKFLTRIHYAAPSSGPWGEHEIDYILIIQKKVNLNANANEVRDVKYVTADELKEMFKDTSLVFTPWFKLICESYLFKWWNELDNLSQCRDDTITHML